RTARRSAWTWPRCARRCGTSGRASVDVDAGLALVCGAEPAEIVEHECEQIEERVQTSDVLDHAVRLKVQIVDAVRKGPAEPAFVVLDLEVDVGLPLHQLADARVREQLLHELLARALDDEVVVEFRLADFDVLRAEE